MDMNCDYLPSLAGEIPCFYKPVFCSHPPRVKNAIEITEYGNWGLHDIATYSCDEGYQIVGNKSISCTYTGRWSAPPQCSPKPTPIIKSRLDPIPIVLPLLFILLVLILVIVAVRYKLQSRKRRNFGVEIKKDQTDILIEQKQNDITTVLLDCASPLKRNRTFDATVFYHFDTDDDFVLDSILPELEENFGFKLCIHSRNFTPGRDIKDNIEESINNSNCAIIVMSQGFVDSIWCKEEFKHCYIENMKDPSFNLFVILMQPEETLINLSNYMKTFFANKTYLQVNDQELFQKLSTHLRNTRNPEDRTVSLVEYDNHDNTDSQDELMVEFTLFLHYDEALEIDETTA